MRLRFKERPAAQQRSWVFMAALGSLGVAAFVGLAFVGFKAPDNIPGRGYYDVNAEFTKADNLTAHYQVRVGGKNVGQVLNPHVKDGKAVVELQMDPAVRPLKSDTTIEVRPRSPVGVRYVDVTPGTQGTPIPEGGTIPASQTKATVQLDQALSTFDPPTRLRAQLFMAELGKGFAGRGDDLNEAIGGAPAALRGVGGSADGGASASAMLRGSSGVFNAIADRTNGVHSLIHGTGTLADSSDPVRQQIADGFKPEARSLRPFTQERPAVQSTLVKAPGTLRTVSTRLPQVDGLVDQLRGFARDVRPGLQAGPESFAQTSALLREARPGLRDTKATLKLAGDAVDPTLALLSTVRPVLPEIDGTVATTTPITNKLGAYGCDIGRFGNQWASMMGFENQDGGVLRFNVQFGPESVYGAGTKSFGNFPTEANPKPCNSGTTKVGR